VNLTLQVVLTALAAGSVYGLLAVRCRFERSSSGRRSSCPRGGSSPPRAIRWRSPGRTP